MNVFLSHLNFMPLIYGVVLFISTMMIIRNITSGRILQAVCVTALIWLGFQMHGHQVESRMGVAIAALLLDLTWSWLFPRRR